MSDDRITRRKFVAGTGAAAAAMIVPRHVLGGPGYTAPSEKLNIAVVGCGGQGMSDAAEVVAGNENIVALCDVDFGYVDRSLAGRTRQPNAESEKMKAAFTGAKRYADFRKMLEQKDIDGVMIATADHMHAIIAKAAMESGKH